mmetsp:Transcript_628/g.1538  ORF Transcript_628/g.1538 Transcript_628/m.1538 type:complete len:201 (+) Transcript_628:201-803(+)
MASICVTRRILCHIRHCRDHTSQIQPVAPIQTSVSPSSLQTTFASTASRCSSAQRHMPMIGPSAPSCTLERRRAVGARASFRTPAPHAQTSERASAAAETSVTFPMECLSAGCTPRATVHRCARTHRIAHAVCASSRIPTVSFATHPLKLTSPRRLQSPMHHRQLVRPFHAHQVPRLVFHPRRKVPCPTWPALPMGPMPC